MHYTELGRTGARVSIVGLGCGGPSKLGLTRGGSSADAVRLVQRALDFGVTFIDTAPLYGTEEVVGQALRGSRSRAFLASKVRPASAEQAEASLDESLRRMETDYLDLLFLHAVAAEEYERVRDELLPMLERSRSAGKVRFIGVTEGFESDQDHAMLSLAISEGLWDCVMAGFNQTAETSLLPIARTTNTGFVAMRAGRRLAPQAGSRDTLLSNFADAAAVAGVHVVLVGASSVQHLEESASAISERLGAT